MKILFTNRENVNLMIGIGARYFLVDKVNDKYFGCSDKLKDIRQMYKSFQSRYIDTHFSIVKAKELIDRVNH